MERVRLTAAGMLQAQGVPLRAFKSADFRVVTALMQTYLTASNTRRQYIVEANGLRGNYLVEALLTSVSDDALTPDITTGEVVELTSNKPEIRKRLQELQDVIDLDQIIDDVVIDLLNYGSYTLRMNVGQDGVENVVDDVDQTNIIAFYKNGYPYEFYRLENNDVNKYPPWKFINFSYGRYRIRIQIQEEFNLGKQLPELPSSAPDYARIGRPLLYGVTSKIKELTLLESLIPALKLNEVVSGSLLGVTVGERTSPEDAIKIVSTYEQIVNRQLTIDRRTGTIALSDILTVAGQFKIIPIFGDKGQLARVDVHESNTATDLLRSVDDVRKVIVNSIGFPYEILFGGETKAELLKKYARYLRKLKALQTSLTFGLKQIALAHLANVGFEDILPSDIIVQFRNELINIDEVEKLEFSDALLTMTQNFHSFMDGLINSEIYSPFVKLDKYMEWLQYYISLASRNSGMITTTPQRGAARSSELGGGLRAPVSTPSLRGGGYNTEEIPLEELQESKLFHPRLLKLLERKAKRESRKPHPVTVLQPQHRSVA